MAELTVSPEARVVRSGAAAGGATELAKSKVAEWFGATKKGISEKIGLKKAEAQIEGNKKASPRIMELGLKGIHGLGTLVEKRADILETKAYNRSDRATSHESKLQELLNKPIEAEERARLYEVSNMTLAMHNLPGEVGPGKPGILGTLKEKAVLLEDNINARWESFWSERDNKIAERDLASAIKYGKGAKAIQEFAAKLEGIVGNRAREKSLIDTKKVVGGEVNKTAAVQQKLEEQFRKVISEGADLGATAIPTVKRVGVSNVSGQEKVVKGFQKDITQTGTQ